MKIFGDRLRALRIEQNKTQEEIANSIGLSKQVISNYEKDARSPDLESLIKLSNYFCVSTDYLLGRVEQKNFENVSVGKETGLSDKAIQNIKDVHEMGMSLILNRFIESKNFRRLIGMLFTIICGQNPFYMGTIRGRIEGIEDAKKQLAQITDEKEAERMKTYIHYNESEYIPFAVNDIEKYSAMEFQIAINDIINQMKSDLSKYKFYEIFEMGGK